MKESEIFINQVGYLPGDEKTVFVSGACKCSAVEFVVRDRSSKKDVFTGKLYQAPDDKAVGEPVFKGDFSSLKDDGEYVVCINGSESFPFKISLNIYDEVCDSALQYFKEARCGQGKCHAATAEIYGTKEKKNVQGGWHDAGDYGRYVITGAKSVMDLLLAYRQTGGKFTNFNLLDEVRFELEWMLQLQRDDGGVYHKISCYNFCGFIMPEEEKEQLVIAPVSTCATADFAGCLAYASTFYKDTDTAFAKKLVEAAVKAQNYLFSHDDELYINPPEITTGGYGDSDVSDERYFALCSLWAVTGEEKYIAHALKIREEKKKEIPDLEQPWKGGWREDFSWSSVAGYGTEILLENADKLDRKVLEEIKSDIIVQAEKTLQAARKSAFGYCSNFISWGSNGAICDSGHLMIMAYDITKRKDLFIAAKQQIDYILGCNPLNYCYVTGEGTKNPVNPHHRPSIARKKIYRGMLVGGPCAELQDAYAKEHLEGMPALKCYVDAVPSYSTNEVAIYWNSAFIYILSRVK